MEELLVGTGGGSWSRGRGCEGCCWKGILVHVVVVIISPGFMVLRIKYIIVMEIPVEPSLSSSQNLLTPETPL